MCNTPSTGFLLFGYLVSIPRNEVTNILRESKTKKPTNLYDFCMYAKTTKSINNNLFFKSKYNGTCFFNKSKIKMNVPMHLDTDLNI